MPLPPPPVPDLSAQVSALTNRVSGLESEVSALRGWIEALDWLELKIADAVVGGHARLPDEVLGPIVNWMREKN